MRNIVTNQFKQNFNNDEKFAVVLDKKCQINKTFTENR